jgi:zinc protease
MSPCAPAVRRHAAAWIALSVLLSAAAVGRATEPVKVTSIEGITEYRLDNGLRVLLFPDPSSANVTVNCTVLVGSRHEGYGEAGMAHLLEHMVFKGTPTFPDVPKALRDHGARFNGTTWVDRTNYFETMPATAENLEFGIKLEADRLVNSLIRKEDLQSEFTVVRSEFESGENNPERVLYQRMLAAAFEWHNYGKSTIGNRSDIERVPVENLRAFYRKYYQPDNAVLVVAGKFEEAAALKLINQYFGALPKPERKLDDTYTEEPAQDGERTVVLRRVGTVGAVGAVYHIPSASHPDHAALEILAEVADTEPTGRLYKAVVETKKASSVRAGAFGWHDPGIFIVQAQVAKEKSLEDARDTMLNTLEGLAKTEFTAEEVERAKRKFAKNRELLMADSGRVALELSEWMAKGDWRLFFLHRDRLEKVTAADLNRVAAAYLVGHNRTVGMYIPAEAPQRATVPASPDLSALLKDYKGRAALTAGESFDPTPANLEARVRRGTTGRIKYAYLPKQTRGDVVHLRLAVRYGNEESLRGKVDAADTITDLLTRGTAKRNRTAFQDELDKLKARLSVSGQPGLISVSVECKKEVVGQVLDLVVEMLREPAFPADEFDTLRRQALDGMKKGLAEPQPLAVNALQRRMSPYPPDDVRYVATIEEGIARLEKLTVEQIKAVYAEQVGGAHMELVAVGAYDPAQTERLDKALADWTSAVPYKRVPRPTNKDFAGGRLQIDTPDKANALYIAAHPFEMTDDDPGYPALKVADFIFGEAALASRLSNRVRGKDGLSYGVGAQLNASPIDKAASFLMFAIHNPVNAEKVDKAIAEELNKMIGEGVTEKELSEAKAAFLQQLKVQRGSDAALAGMLAGGLFLNRTFDYYAKLEEKVASLSAAEVSSAFREHIKPEKLLFIRAGDFTKKPPADGKK